MLTAGAESIRLMGLSSRTADFVPQGLLENVRNPLVVHSQIWVAVAGGAAGESAAMAIVAIDIDIDTSANKEVRLRRKLFMGFPCNDSADRLMIAYFQPRPTIA
jgi:hypothetical protein